MGLTDKASNKAEELKGKGKEATGQATDDLGLRLRAKRVRPRVTSSRPAKKSLPRRSADEGSARRRGKISGTCGQGSVMFDF